MQFPVHYAAEGLALGPGPSLRIIPHERNRAILLQTSGTPALEQIEIFCPLLRAGQQYASLKVFVEEM